MAHERETKRGSGGPADDDRPAGRGFLARCLPSLAARLAGKRAQQMPADAAPASPALAQVAAEEDEPRAPFAEAFAAADEGHPGHVEPRLGPIAGADGSGTTAARERREAELGASEADAPDAWEGAPLPKDARLAIDDEPRLSSESGGADAESGGAAGDGASGPEGAASAGGGAGASGRRRRFPWKLAGEAAFVAAVAAGVWWGADRFMALPYFNIERLEMQGDAAKVPLARLKDAVEGAVVGNYFTADLDQVRAAAETVPWVKKASVRRLWPNGLEVTVEVHQAMAVYEDGRLVSTEGVLFSANPEEGAEAVDLPNFYGAPSLVMEIARHYKRFSAAAAAIPAKITDVTLSDRGAWTLVMASDVIPPTKVELGRDDSDEAAHQEAGEAHDAAAASKNPAAAVAAFVGELFGELSGAEERAEGSNGAESALAASGLPLEGPASAEAAAALEAAADGEAAEASAAAGGQCRSVQRFAAIAAAYPLVAEVLKGPPSSIDARYRRGFAAGLVDRKAVAAWREDMAAKRAAALAAASAASPAFAASAAGAAGAEAAPAIPGAAAAAASAAQAPSSSGAAWRDGMAAPGEEGALDLREALRQGGAAAASASAGSAAGAGESLEVDESDDPDDQADAAAKPGEAAPD